MPVKMFFCSSDNVEVGQLSSEFRHAGIPSHLHEITPTIRGYETQVELWVDNARDCQRAMRLCAKRKIGLGGQHGS